MGNSFVSSKFRQCLESLFAAWITAFVRAIIDVSRFLMFQKWYQVKLRRTTATKVAAIYSFFSLCIQFQTFKSMSHFAFWLQYCQVIWKWITYYVLRQGLFFLTYLLPYLRTFSVHKVRENCHFLNTIPTPILIKPRRLWMAPNT